MFSQGKPGDKLANAANIGNYSGFVPGEASGRRGGSETAGRRSLAHEYRCIHPVRSRRRHCGVYHTIQYHRSPPLDPCPAHGACRRADDWCDPGVHSRSPEDCSGTDTSAVAPQIAAQARYSSAAQISSPNARGLRTREAGIRLQRRSAAAARKMRLTRLEQKENYVPIGTLLEQILFFHKMSTASEPRAKLRKERL